MVINGKEIFVYVFRNLVEILWGKYGVEYVVELIGVFIIIEKVGVYLIGGVKRVIIFVFFADVFMFVMGVNEDKYDKLMKVIRFVKWLGFI